MIQDTSKDRTKPSTGAQKDASVDTSTDTLDKLSVVEAAKRLGVTQDAVYKRIKRGTIRADTGVDGLTYVYLDSSVDTPGTSTDKPTGKSIDALITAQQDQIDYLREQLAVWQEEARRKDHIIAALTERIPELEAPSESRGSSLTPCEGEDRVEATPEEEKRPWWRRFFDL